MSTLSIDKLFVYGTLLNQEILQTLLGYVPEMSSASIDGFQRHAVRDDVYPAVRPDANHTVEGMILYGLSSRDFEMLDHFEGESYDRVPVIAQQRSESCMGDVECYLYVIQAHFYEWLEPRDWCNETFRRETLDDYLMMLASSPD